MTRSNIIDAFRRTRRRSSEIFDFVPLDLRLDRPISLRHPIVFYEGHLPAFYVNTIVKRGLGRAGVDEGLERLFARGIDPEDERAAAGRAVAQWPSRETLRAFVEACDELTGQTLATGDLVQPGHPVLDRGQGVFASIEHELMHQETLLYILHRMAHGQKRAPSAPRLAPGGAPPAPSRVSIPAGRATLGARLEDVAFGWDNEFPAHAVDVPAFVIDLFDVTNRDYLEFLDAGGYRTQALWSPGDWAWRESQKIDHPLFWERRGDQWTWRGQFEDVPLPDAWPVYVTHAEASAYARWKGGRLPTEAEYHRAAFGTPEGRERPYPWGDEPPDATRGNFDFASWDPVPTGAYPSGASAWGVHDLVGNGWEWTSTIFGPFDGFHPMASYPEYSADFFDGQHYVLKGASPATARELVRASFRNWFRPHYPYVYATFRVVSDHEWVEP